MPLATDPWQTADFYYTAMAAAPMASDTALRDDIAAVTRRAVRRAARNFPADPPGALVQAARRLLDDGTAEYLVRVVPAQRSEGAPPAATGGGAPSGADSSPRVQGRQNA